MEIISIVGEAANLVAAGYQLASFLKKQAVELYDAYVSVKELSREIERRLPFFQLLHELEQVSVSTSSHGRRS